MKIDVFGKHITGDRTNESGKKVSYDFYSYSGRLYKKNGDVEVVRVKFSVIDPPEKCPITLIVPRGCANLQYGTYEKKDKDGNIIEVKETKTLWISAFTEKEYIDHTLDDYETDDDFDPYANHD